MAISSATTGDFFLDQTRIPCIPKSGYVPAKGDFVRRETAQGNEVDMITTDEAPFGMVLTVGPGATPSICGVVKFVPGTTVVMPNANGAQPALGDKVEGDGGGRVALGTTGLTRTRIRTDNTNGVGVVIARDSGGTDTVTVEF